MKNNNIINVLLDRLSATIYEVDVLVKEDGHYLRDNFIKSVRNQDTEAGKELIACSARYRNSLLKISRAKEQMIDSLDEVTLYSLLYETTKAKNDITIALENAKSIVEYKRLRATATFVEGTNTIPNYNRALKWDELDVTTSHDVELKRKVENNIKDAVEVGVNILLSLSNNTASNEEKSKTVIAQEKLRQANAALGRILIEGVAKNNPFIIVNDHMAKNGKTYYVPSKLPFANVSMLSVRLSDERLVSDLDQLTIVTDYLTGDLFGNIVANRAKNSPIIDEYIVTINPQCESYKVLMSYFKDNSVNVDGLREVLTPISWGLFDGVYLDSSNIVFVIGLRSKFQQ